MSINKTIFAIAFLLTIAQMANTIGIGYAAESNITECTCIAECGTYCEYDGMISKGFFYETEVSASSCVEAMRRLTDSCSRSWVDNYGGECFEHIGPTICQSDGISDPE